MQYQFSRVVIGPVLHAVGRPKVVGIENVPAAGPAILASNHLSFIDSMYLPLVVDRPVVFPAKAEYFTAKGPVGRLWAAYLRSTNQLEMDRDGARSAQATLEAALDILRAGELFGFYPEGTRSPDGRLYRGRSGIGWLALNSGAPVIPVAMMGTRKMLPPGAPLPRPTRIEVRIGRPLDFGHLAGEPPARARRTVADDVMRAIGDLSGQEYVHLYASDVKAVLAKGTTPLDAWPATLHTFGEFYKPHLGIFRTQKGTKSVQSGRQGPCVTGGAARGPGACLPSRHALATCAAGVTLIPANTLVPVNMLIR